MLADLLVAGLEAGDFEAVARVAATTTHATLSPLACGVYRSKERKWISSAPRAVDTLEAALWCVARCGSFDAAVIEAVNLGGDTDTIGAVTGQLAGAVHGASAIPGRWIDGLNNAPWLAELATRLHRAGQADLT
jgi:ADP-ribosyl-[dinitrogen reductase] hydrolase